ncbi:PTS galactitol transporter subunit IIC [Pelosinus propionicus]|uniref:PTS system, galactitol-specific IIC component n=1 Tax=Pelosinus propionicus DSM 13327 TaxID=1123291 RepID=A0A1I4HXS5_9FIRM|nr:PTS transporter subunit IIC [Pelosinus propionicus]SFL46680.1 PTS system, galactitol-specific IIC component [Pelosinus propionicus DSM 13327]
MDFIAGIFEFFLGLGASVFLPILISIFAIILGQKPGRAIRSGITIGIGFIAIGAILGIFVSNLGPAAEAMVKRFGVNLTVLDAGWPATASIAFASKIGAFIIPLGITINAIMLVTKMTDVVDVDIFNYWHFTFVGALVYGSTDNLLLGYAAAGLALIVGLKTGDFTAKYFQKYYGYEGVSIPHILSNGFAIIGWPLNKIIDMIPGIRDIKADPGTISKKFGIMGEPTVMGIILGAGIGILAGYDISKILNLAIIMAAVMMLLPRMVGILMEGLLPVSDAAKEFFSKKYSDREFTIGLDSAIAVGDPAVLASSLLLVPIALGLAIVLPGNKVLPFGDLATIPFMICIVNIFTKGNVFRNVLIGSFLTVFALYSATINADTHTAMAIAAGFTMPEGASTLSSFVGSSNPITLAIWKLFSLFG